MQAENLNLDHRKTKAVTDNIIELTDSERDALAAELSYIQYDPSGGCSYINDLRFIAMRTLPRRLLVLLNKQKSSLRPRPFIQIKNLPVDEKIHFIPNPNQYNPIAKSGSISENLLIAIGSIIGEAYSIHFEGSEVINNLIPTRAGRNDLTGIGSEVELDFHIENAALKCLKGANYSPMGLLLTGVNHDPNGPMTRVADSREALELLDAEVINTLRSPLYSIKVPYRWRNFFGSNCYETDWTSILREGHSYIEVAVAFYKDMVKCKTPEAQKAFDLFSAAIRSVSLAFDITPGTLVYIDNRFALHSRDRFTPKFDERGISTRWLQRLFVASNLWNYRDLQQIQNRVFQPANNGGLS